MIKCCGSAIPGPASAVGRESGIGKERGRDGEGATTELCRNRMRMFDGHKSYFGRHRGGDGSHNHYINQNRTDGRTSPLPWIKSKTMTDDRPTDGKDKTTTWEFDRRSLPPSILVWSR